MDTSPPLVAETLARFAAGLEFERIPPAYGLGYDGTHIGGVVHPTASLPPAVSAADVRDLTERLRA